MCPGRDSRVFVEKYGFKCSGIDRCSELLDIAKMKSPKTIFFNTDIRDLGYFEDESFEGIWSCASLVHIPHCEVPSLLKQSFRILTNSGVFFVSVKKGIGEELKGDPRYNDCEKFWNYFQKGEWEERLEEQGFRILSTNSSEKSNDYQTHDFINIFVTKYN